MNKIDYPTLTRDLAKFESEYYSALKVNETLINTHLARVTYTGTLTFDSLVKLSFEELIKLGPEIERYSKTQEDEKTLPGGKKIITNKFTELFDYKNNQPRIARFFMKWDINSRICPYCAIDFVNSFNDFPDYDTGLEFVNHAEAFELQYIKEIDEHYASAIINQRNTGLYTDIDHLPVGNSIKRRVRRIPFNNTHNHFTLDHFIPQNTFRFYSLCLYNLIPCCYSCNSKFKKVNKFSWNEDWKYVCPSSKDYCLPEHLQFKVLFLKALPDVSSVSDFRIQIKIKAHENYIQSYLKMLKIPGRYVYHKFQILQLIKKKVKYSESKIDELSKQTGISAKKIRSIIFGKELFYQKKTTVQLSKFKRDIAKSILIEGV